jgi:hypothetical protein
MKLNKCPVIVSDAPSGNSPERRIMVSCIQHGLIDDHYMPRTNGYIAAMRTAQEHALTAHGLGDNGVWNAVPQEMR